MQVIHKKIIIIVLGMITVVLVKFKFGSMVIFYGR